MAFLNATFYFYLLGFIITSLFVLLKLTRPTENKPNLPPSPPKLPILGNIHQLGPLPYRSFRDLSLKYGPLLWLQLGQIPALLVSSADLARELIKNQDSVFASSGKIKELKDTFKAVDGFFDEVIEDHKKVMKKKKKDDDEKNDFVDILIQLKETNMLEFEPTKDDLKAIVTDMFLGGNETTSTTLEWILSELRRNPRIMKKAQEEVRKVVGSKSKVEESDLNEMKYLKLVMKEALSLSQKHIHSQEVHGEQRGMGYGLHLPRTSQVGNQVHQDDPAREFFSLMDESDRPLYQGCHKYSKLSFLIKLYHIKCMCGISDKAMSMFWNYFEMRSTARTFPHPSTRRRR
ncbi:hypothetical protein K1719_045433 [Acacia pycnantha]|nr:hypothetical protein K1719_045433 [Acacia pycnantha]